MQIKWNNLKIISVLLILFFLGYMGWCYNKVDKVNIEKSFCFKIEKWTNNSVIISDFCNKIGLNRLCCKILKYKIWDKKLKRWKYCFETGLSINEIISRFEKWPPARYVKFTIYPWFTKYDIASKLSSENLKKEFLKLVVDKDFIDKLKRKFIFLNEFWEIKSLEWFLYPDTYYFRPEDLKSILFPQLLIKTSVKNFWQKRKNIWYKCKEDKQCNPYNLTPYEILIIASIIAKEEPNSKYKPLVADVLIRRYKNWRLIGADRTLCYGLKVLSKDCYENINYSTLNDKSNVYNTRTIKWLPPTPVWNPTTGDIEAVLYPQKNNYRYYLHDKNGNIHFWKTLNEHNANKAKYLWN